MKDADLIRIAHTGTTWEVGDIVVGNEEANIRYSMTRKGSKLRIVKLDGDSFEGIMVDTPDIDEDDVDIDDIGRYFVVRVNCFDFYCKEDDFEGDARPEDNF